MLTLQELKQVVGNRKEKRKVPSARYLRENDVAVVKHRLIDGAEIIAYQTGYVFYCAGDYGTVFPLFTCRDYVYEAGRKITVVKEDFFDNQPWYVCHLQETCGYENLIVYVDNPEQLSRTQLEVTRILKNYRVMKADNLFQKMEIPLLQVVRVVKMMLGLSVVSSVLVITLLLSMWMRARKKEIAIYVSLGKTKVDLFMQIILECFSVFGFSTIIALYTGDKMLIVLEKFLDWKSIGAFTSMQIYAQNKDICYLILSGTIILLLSISISLFPILCTKPKKILAEMEG